MGSLGIATLLLKNLISTWEISSLHLGKEKFFGGMK